MGSRGKFKWLTVFGLERKVFRKIDTAVMESVGSFFQIPSTKNSRGQSAFDTENFAAPILMNRLKFPQF